MLKVVIGFVLTAILAFRSLQFLVLGLYEGQGLTAITTAFPFFLITFLIGYFSWTALRNRRILKAKELVARKKENITKELLYESTHKNLIFKYLGGSGYDFNKSEFYSFGVINDKIRLISNNNDVTDVNYSEVNSYEIGGAGTTTTSAGITGGGFGLEGFIKGAVTAAVINAATTKSSTNTLLKITSRNGEIFLHTTMCEPEELRMMLSPLSISISKRAASTTVSVADELSKLNDLLKAGVINEDDFKNAKNKIISS